MKKIYRKITKLMSLIYIKFYVTKTKIAEWTAILRKKELYKDTTLSNTEIKEIYELWEDNANRKISLRWHRLYKSINNKFDKKYFPDYLFSTKLEPKLNSIAFSKFMSDKSVTELIYNKINEVGFPRTIIVNSNNYYYDSERKIINKNYAIKILKEQNSFVIKPTIGGSSGNSVQVVDLNDINKANRETFINEILRKYDKNYIIQEKLLSHESYAVLYPYSINTIRLITYIVKDEIFNAPLCLRMGSGGKKVDNVHAGGIVVGVSDDGVLSKYGYQLGYSDSKVKYKQHPDTGVKFENYKIAKTEEMIKLAKELHGCTPHLGIISWDFMVNNDKEVVLVEGNYFGQSIWFPQIIHEKSIFGVHTEYMIQQIK